MIPLIIKSLLIIIAAVAKAVVDTIHHHPKTMVFKGDFWRLWPRGKVLPFTNYPLDGWHVFNSLMILAFIGAGTLPGYRWYIDIPVAGVLFIAVFNICYNKLFVK
jgi:hypothetical protein